MSISTAVLAAILACPAAGQIYAQSLTGTVHPNASSSDPCTGAWTFSPTTVTLNSANQWKVQVTATLPAGCTTAWYSQPAAGADFVLTATTRTGYAVTGSDYFVVVGDPNPPKSPDFGTVYIYSAAGTTVFATLSATDFTAPPLALACPSSTGVAGGYYSSSLVASGGKPPYSYAIPGGYLDGIFLNGTSGVFAGTPTVAGTFSFTVTVSDYSGKPPATFSCSLMITAKNPPMLACPASTGTVGALYSSALSATGGMPPYKYSLASGALAAGLVLNGSTGSIGGTPTTAGTDSFTAQVVDSSGTPATAACSIAISPISANCTSDDVKNLLSHVPVSSRSHIYATGPYSGGTVMLEDALDSSQSSAVKPVSLEIASSAATGTYCAYWIDDDVDSRVPASYHYPSVKFNHPVRFAWTKHGDTSEYGVAAANNTLTIHPEGGHTPAPFTFYSDETVSGVPVTFGSGDFAAEPVPPTTSPALEQSHQFQAAPEAAGAFAPACLSWALIIDGGDTRKYPSGDIAAAAAADAVLMDTWLTGRGFHVQRVSQYWDNAIPQPHYLTGAQRASLFDDITKYVNRYTNTPTAPGCHHEFFLYISSHGNLLPGRFYLFDSFGAGNNQTVSYDDLFTRLNAFPTDLKHETTVYTMIDACYAGIGAVYARLDFKVNGIAKPGHLALQMLACGDASHTCPGGHSARVNSATQDFMKDPKTMTTGFEAMVDGTDGRNPVRLRLPDFAANWFGLDSR